MYLKIGCLPPRCFCHNVSLCTSYQKSALRLYPQSAGCSGNSSKVTKRYFSKKIQPVLSPDCLKFQFLVILPKKFQHRQHAVTSKFRKATAVLLICQLPRVWCLQLRETGFHISDTTDRPTACNSQEPAESRTICGLDSFKKYQSPFLRVFEQFFRLDSLHHHGLFTQHVFPMFQSCLNVIVMSLMGRCDIHHINNRKKIFNVQVCVNPPLLSELCRTSRMRIISCLYTASADKFCLHKKPAGNPAGSYNPYPLYLLFLFP